MSSSASATSYDAHFGGGGGSGGGGGGGSKDVDDAVMAAIQSGTSSAAPVADSAQNPRKRPNTTKTRELTLVLKDGRMTVDYDLMTSSKVIKVLLGQDDDGSGSDGSDSEDEDTTRDIEVPLRTIDLETMKIVVDYLEYHRTREFTPVPCPLPSNQVDEMVKDAYDKALITKADKEDQSAYVSRMAGLANAGEFLDIEPFTQLFQMALAVLLKGVTQEQAFVNFGLPPDTKITPEMKADIEKRYPQFAM